MKRFLLIVLLFFSVIFVFSVNIEKAQELFLYYINNYDKQTNDQFLNDVKLLISKELPLYRFYKIWLVGSVEKTDVTKKVGDYLNVIYKQYQGTTDEERLARATFMSYLEAKLERKSFESSFIKASPNFNHFFNTYQNKVVFAARNYFTDLLAKHLGAKIDLPIEIDAPVYNFDFNYFPRYKEKGYDYELQYLASDPEFVKTFNKYLQILSENPETIEKQIGRYGGLLQRSIIKVIAGLKNNYSEIFSTIAPSHVSYWWIRWIVYALLILVTFFVLKKWSLTIFIISIIEIVYLFFGFDVLSNSSSTIYGLISVFGFISAILIFMRQKEILALVMSLLVILSFFVPTFYSKDLLMKNNVDFENSIFFEELVGDVLKDNYSRFSNIIKGLLTQSNSSIIETEDIVRRLAINTKNFQEKIQDPKYLSVNNFEQRIEDFKTIAKEFENYQIEENIRKRKYASFEKDVLKFTKKIAEISSKKFEDNFLQEITKKLNFEEVEPTVTKINDTLEKVEDMKSAPIKFYRTKYGLLAFMFLSIGMFLTSIKYKYDYVWYIAAIISTIFMLINPIEFIVQYGVPTLLVNYSMTIPIIVVPGIVMFLKRIIPHKG
ncbi:hypothetical protein [Thermosipho atlanticus]|uniref:Uncharacterized protein n=1 Tax=Thermosipho atlanticus DSM 15807 TaxID=1123380 RepID=A0A1M5SIA0_9BACT|nr:hypothetical protein [Thermosipho atlanticus]SHH38266.1 hypothetical protein SAMN02745199_0892 [Thermosipho atlanticus DSM 15807]